MTTRTFKAAVNGITFDATYCVDDDGDSYAQAVRIGGSIDLIGHLSELTLIEIEHQADADYAAWLESERQSALDSKAEELAMDRAA